MMNELDSRGVEYRINMERTIIVDYCTSEYFGEWNTKALVIIDMLEDDYDIFPDDNLGHYGEYYYVLDDSTLVRFYDECVDE